MRDSCWAAISELLKGSTDADIPFVQAVLSYSLQMLNTSVVKPVRTPSLSVFAIQLYPFALCQITSADDRDEQFSLQSALCGAIQVIINRLASGIEPSANDIMAALHRVHVYTIGFPVAYPCLIQMRWDRKPRSYFRSRATRRWKTVLWQ